LLKIATLSLGWFFDMLNFQINYFYSLVRLCMKYKILIVLSIVGTQFFASQDDGSEISFPLIRTKRINPIVTDVVCSSGKSKDGKGTRIQTLDFQSFVQAMKPDSVKRKAMSDEQYQHPLILKKTRTNNVMKDNCTAIQSGPSSCMLDDLKGLIELSCSPTQTCYQHYASSPRSCKTSQDVIKVIRSLNNGFLTLSPDAKNFFVREIVDHSSSKAQALAVWSEFADKEKIHPVSSDKVVEKITQEYDALDETTAKILLEFSSLENLVTK
jgi:hypothetical protein